MKSHGYQTGDVVSRLFLTGKSHSPHCLPVATISPRTDLVRSASSTEVGIQRRSSTIITRRPKGVRHSRSFMEDANPTLKYLDVPLTHGPPSQPIIFEDLTIRRSPSPALLRPTSRMSCLSASTDIASSASTPSRSPSPAFPFTPQSTSVAEAGISSSPEKDWDTAMNDSSPQPTYAGYNSTYGYDVQIGPVPRRTSVAGQPYLYPRYPPSLGRVSGSTSSLRGPRPRPLSTRPSVSNLLGLANIKVI